MFPVTRLLILDDPYRRRNLLCRLLALAADIQIVGVIGAELGLTAQTVRNYVVQVCKKLGLVRNKLQKPLLIKME